METEQLLTLLGDVYRIIDNQYGTKIVPIDKYIKFIKNDDNPYSKKLQKLFKEGNLSINEIKTYYDSEMSYINACRNIDPWDDEEDSYWAYSLQLSLLDMAKKQADLEKQLQELVNQNGKYEDEVDSLKFDLKNIEEDYATLLEEFTEKIPQGER